MKGKKGNRRGGKIEAKWGVKKREKRPLGISSQTEGLYEGNQQRGFYQREKAQGGFKETMFSKEMHFLKAQKQFRPLFVCQKFHRGANRFDVRGNG